MTATLKPCGIEGILTSYILNIEQVAASPTTRPVRVGRKEEKTMTKYYFISYIHCNGSATTYGHCIMQVNNSDLTGITREIQKINNFKTLPTIICLKDLSKKEYEMLKGKEK